MKTKLRIYIDNPILLDLEEANIERINDEEIFVQLSFINEAYYLSQFGRCYSAYKKRILKVQLYGNKCKRLRPSYTLINRDGKRNNYFAHRLVAQVFCKPIKTSRKVEVHHKDKTSNSQYTNLMHVESDAHKLIDRGIKLYLCDPEHGTLKRFMSFPRLCNYTGTDIKRVYRAIYSDTPDFHVSEDINGYIVRKEMYKGAPLHIALERDEPDIEIGLTEGIFIVGLLLFCYAGYQRAKRV